MKAWQIVGYSYDADIHCLDCIEQSGIDIDRVDSEGNERHPVFVSDYEDETCGQCGCYLIEIDCPICGDSIIKPHSHEQLTQLQPSLHTLEEYAELLIGEAEALEVDISKIDTDMTDPESVDWIIDAVIEAIAGKGYCVVQEADYLAIHEDINRGIV